MELTDFQVNLYDFVERTYSPRGKKAALETHKTRKMFTFTLAWRGLIAGRDPLDQTSYIGAEHKGCMFYAGAEELDWGFAKTSSARGIQIVPSKPDVGLRTIVLKALNQTAHATVLAEDVALRRASIIPDPENEGTKVVIE